MHKHEFEEAFLYGFSIYNEKKERLYICNKDECYKKIFKKLTPPPTLTKRAERNE